MDIVERLQADMLSRGGMMLSGIERFLLIVLMLAVIYVVSYLGS